MNARKKWWLGVPLAFVLAGAVLFGCIAAQRSDSGGLSKTNMVCTLYATYEGVGLEQASEQADHIVDLTVHRKTGELQQDIPATFFEATINEDMTGNFQPGDTISLRQDGTSTSPIDSFPLFQANDRLILCLKASSAGSLDTNGNSYYWIYGGASCAFDVVETGNKLFAVSKYTEYPSLAAPESSLTNTHKNTLQRKVRLSEPEQEISPEQILEYDTLKQVLKQK